MLQELLDHLEGMLSNEAVEVSGGQSIVEVKPQVGANLGPAGPWQHLQGALLPCTQASSCPGAPAPGKCTLKKQAPGGLLDCGTFRVHCSS